MFSKEGTFSEKNKGGLGIPDVNLFFKTLRTKFAMQAQSSTQSWAVILRENFCRNKITLMSIDINTDKLALTTDRMRLCYDYQQAFYGNANYS